MPKDRRPEIPVTKRFVEEGRHGDTYTGTREPGGKRLDWQDRIKRKSEDQSKARGEQGFDA